MSAPISRMVRHALRMMVGTLASRVLGLVREMLVAALFGATRSLDAFYVAYTLANLSRQLLAEGALSASFVPVFSRVLADRGREAAHRLARQALSVLLIAGGTAVGIGVAASPLLVALMAPGFSPAERSLAVGLTRALFPFLLLVSVGALAMGVLNSLDSFFVPAVAPAASNLTFILFLLCFLHHPDLPILVSAVLLGGCAHLLLQWVWCARKGMPLLPLRPDRRDPDLRRMLALFLPYAAGLSLNQVNPVVSRMLGSFLEGGSISVLNYADRVLQLPLGLFVIAISQAVLPMLSRLSPEDREGFAEFVRDALRFNLFVVLPVALGLFLFSPQVVHLLFVRGKFGDWAWHATATVLSLYGLGLPGMSSVTVLMRALYARSLPRAAVRVTAFTVTANLLFSFLLMRFFSYAGLAAATALAFTGAAAVGARALARDLGSPLKIFDRRWTGRLLGSCGAMVGGLLLYRILLPYPVSSGLGPRSLWLCGAALLGAGLYGGASLVLRCPEWEWLRGALSSRGRRDGTDRTTPEGEEGANVG